MKYPSTPEGLAVSPYELGFVIPTEEDYQIKGGVEMHHLYHFNRWYQPESDGYGAWRQVFRNLIEHVPPMLTNEHNKGFTGSVHDKYSPPRMPKDSTMIGVVEQHLTENGLIYLHNYRRSQPPKILPASQWIIIKRRYKG